MLSEGPLASLERVIHDSCELTLQPMRMRCRVRFPCRGVDFEIVFEKAQVIKTDFVVSIQKLGMASSDYQLPDNTLVLGNLENRKREYRIGHHRKGYDALDTIAATDRALKCLLNSLEATVSLEPLLPNFSIVTQIRPCQPGKKQPHVHRSVDFGVGPLRTEHCLDRP